MSASSPSKSSKSPSKASSAALRAAKRKGHYKAQFARTEANAKRTLRRHLRAHPGDALAAKRYEFQYGTPEPLGLASRGRKRAARARAQEERAALIARRLQVGS